jgi:predicted nuclease of predicted toxin-antitoxin system
MNFLLDENLPFAIMELLSRNGHTAYHIKKLGKTGIVNGEVYKLAIELDAWLITRDKDFRNLEKFMRHAIPGIILLVADHDLIVSEMISIISQFITNHLPLLDSKKLIEIEDGNMKVNE